MYLRKSINNSFYSKVRRTRRPYQTIFRCSQKSNYIFTICILLVSTYLSVHNTCSFHQRLTQTSFENLRSTLSYQTLFMKKILKSTPQNDIDTFERLSSFIYAIENTSQPLQEYMDNTAEWIDFLHHYIKSIPQNETDTLELYTHAYNKVLSASIRYQLEVSSYHTYMQGSLPKLLCRQKNPSLFGQLTSPFLSQDNFEVVL